MTNHTKNNYNLPSEVKLWKLGKPPTPDELEKDRSDKVQLRLEIEKAATEIGGVDLKNTNSNSEQIEVDTNQHQNNIVESVKESFQSRMDA